MPYKNREDFNAYRRAYRKRKAAEGFCPTCFRPRLEDSARLDCECCAERKVKAQFLRRNFNGDN